jgi:hypothetical protein
VKGEMFLVLRMISQGILASSTFHDILKWVYLHAFYPPHVRPSPEAVAPQGLPRLTAFVSRRYSSYGLRLLTTIDTEKPGPG